MRLAILADIHGNLPAFEAVLADVEKQRPDQVIIAGDVVDGMPDSLACWQLAQSLGCPILRGNHERYVAHFDTPEESPLWKTERFAPLHYAINQLSAADRSTMNNLPTLLRLPHLPDLLLVHATARNDYDTITAHTPEAEIAQMFTDAPERYIVRAHNHIGQTRIWQDDRFIITDGSIGLPMDGNPTAQYLLLDQRLSGWRTTHRSIPYSLGAVHDRIKETNYLAQTGPIGRLFYREVITATMHLVPFFRLYTQWTAEDPSLSLSMAVDRFLGI